MQKAEEAIELKEYHRAEVLLLGALAQAKKWGEADPRLASVLYTLGELNRRQGNLEQAEPYFWQALPIWVKSLGAEHPNMAKGLVSLSQIYMTRQDYRKAEPLIKQALRIQEKVDGKDHPHLSSILETYSTILRNLNRVSEAKKLELQKHAIVANQ